MAFIFVQIAVSLTYGRLLTVAVTCLYNKNVFKALIRKQSLFISNTALFIATPTKETSVVSQPVCINR